MIRHSRETLATLLAWYAGCAMVGVVTLLMVGVGLRTVGYSVTPERALLGMVIASPFLILAMVLAWNRVEPVYRERQVKALLTSTNGLNALHEDRKRKRRT
jgi:hypothetical protein